MRRRLFSLILHIVLAFVAATVVAEPAAEQAPPAKSGSMETITITDSAGQTITFDAPPKRIVIAGRAVFMLVDAMYLFPQARDRVVAVGETEQGLGDFFPVIDPDAETLPRIGRTAGVEDIAAQNPDLVVLKTFMQDSLGNQLEAVGIPVLYLDLETPDAFVRDLRIIGQLFDNSDRAEEVIRLYDERLNRILQAVDGLDRPSVILLSYKTSGEGYSFGVAPEGWIQTDQVRLGGGLPEWFDGAVSPGWNQVQFEQIALWDPEVIFMVSYRTPASVAVAAVQDDPLWEELRAVRRGRLLAVPNDFYSWAQPDTRWILGAEWAARMLHPGTLDGTMEESVAAFFQNLYGVDAETYARVIAPKLEGDGL